MSMIYNLYKTIKYLLRTKDADYLIISVKSYEYLKYFLRFILIFNSNFKHCTFFRYLGKKKHISVVVALRYYGRNVRRRTNGAGKEFIMKSKNIPLCLYCDEKLLFSNISVDHIIPISLGGNNSYVNLIKNCCITCNMERGNSDFYTFLYSKKPIYKTLKYPAV